MLVRLVSDVVLIGERRIKTLSRLREQYENEIKDALIKKFGYKTTGNTKRSIRDAEEDEKQVSGSQTYQHDGCSVIAGPVSLLFTHV